MRVSGSPRSAGSAGANLDAPKSVLARALSILDSFGPADVELALPELCERSGLPKTTVHRLVAELVGWGALERSRRGVRLGHRLFTLGEQVHRYQRLRELATPFLEDLYQATRESAHLAVLEGSEVVYLAKICGHESAPTASFVGCRLPTHCTGVGKALLGYDSGGSIRLRLEAGLIRLTPHTLSTPGALHRDLASAKERGFSVDREETRMGIVSVAAPVLGRDDRPLAAIAVAGRTHTIRIDRIAADVQVAARGLSSILAGA